MGSRASSNCSRKIHRTSTPEKEVNRKENTVGKIANFEKATDSKVYNAQIPIWPSSIPLLNVLRQGKRLLAQFLLPFKFTVTFKNRMKIMVREYSLFGKCNFSYNELHENSCFSMSESVAGVFWSLTKG